MFTRALLGIQDRSLANFWLRRLMWGSQNRIGLVQDLLFECDKICFGGQLLQTWMSKLAAWINQFSKQAGPLTTTVDSGKIQAMCSLWHPSSGSLSGGTADQHSFENRKAFAGAYVSLAYCWPLVSNSLQKVSQQGVS